jgi:hypothetical protein
MGAIRGIVDSDPIDVPRLEISLREAIAAVKKTREAIAAGPKRRKTGLDDLLKGFDSYCKSLLAKIVGQQH